jgi:flagellar motor switch protein FliN/FliY
MNAEQALDQLTESTARAVVDTLQTFCGEEIAIAGSTVVPRGTNPLGALDFPAVVAGIQYLDGVSGGNLFAITAEGAKKIAAQMMGGELEDDGQDVPELALSAVGEAANQMLAAAGAATAKVLGEEVEIDPPQIRVVGDAEEAMADQPMTQHVTSVSFSVLGEPCRLVQLIPQSFIVKMQFALQERAGEIDPAVAAAGAAAEPTASQRGSTGDWLRESKLRLSVELGRAQMPASKAVTLPNGSIVELNRQADEPVDLYVNGAPFATGRLLLVGGTDWAVRIESFHNASSSSDEDADAGTTTDQPTATATAG